MAIDPVLPIAAVASVDAVDGVVRQGGKATDILAALKAGQAVDALVVATLETGEARLQLLGVLLDIVPAEPLAVGDALRLTVASNDDGLAVIVDRRPPADEADVTPEPGGATRLPPDAAPLLGRAALPQSSPTPSGPLAVGDVVDLSLAARLAGPSSQAAASQAAAGEAAAGAAVPVATVVQGRPAGPPPSAEARAALAQMLPQAAAGQQSRAPLIANAIAVLAGPGGEWLPPTVREALQALVASVADPSRLDSAALRSAIDRSGTFQESAILRAALAGTDPSSAAPPDGTSLSARATPAADTALQADAKGIMLALRSALKAVTGEGVPVPLRLGDPPPLPQRGTVTVAQPAAPASLTAQTPPHEAVRTLLAGTEGALDRVRLLQVASLPDDRRPAETGPRVDRLAEIPVALANGQVPMMSIAVGRDGRASAGRGDAPAWRMRLSLDLDATGPLHALVSLRGGRAGVTLWAERPETADLFRSSLPDLRDALTVADLDIDSLDVRSGAPARAEAAPAGSFVDVRS